MISHAHNNIRTNCCFTFRKQKKFNLTQVYIYWQGKQNDSVQREHFHLTHMLNYEPPKHISNTSKVYDMEIHFKGFWYLSFSFAEGWHTVPDNVTYSLVGFHFICTRIC